MSTRIKSSLTAIQARRVMVTVYLRVVGALVYWLLD